MSKMTDDDQIAAMLTRGEGEKAIPFIMIRQTRALETIAELLTKFSTPPTPLTEENLQNTQFFGLVSAARVPPDGGVIFSKDHEPVVVSSANPEGPSVGPATQHEPGEPGHRRRRSGDPT